MGKETANAFQSMSREELLRALEMFAKNWLAHDGCWFLAAEEQFNMETAVELDARSWKRFAGAERPAHHGDVQHPIKRWARSTGNIFESAPLCRDQLAENRMVP